MLLYHIHVHIYKFWTMFCVWSFKTYYNQLQPNHAWVLSHHCACWWPSIVRGHLQAQWWPSSSYLLHAHVCVHALCLCMCMNVYECVYVCMYMYVCLKVYTWRVNPGHIIRKLNCLMNGAYMKIICCNLTFFTHWPLGDVQTFQKYDIGTCLMESYLKHILWNCPRENATEPHWW